MVEIKKYFPELQPAQYERFDALLPLYLEWNQRINVISRKDMENFSVHHVLHSLGIARAIQFKAGTRVLDVGTGGGFPGIPLAILFPETEFLLVDSIGKKIRVVNEVANAIDLKNVKALHSRAEDLPGKFDYVVSRAVTALPVFVGWVKDKISAENRNSLTNGILYLKGGEFEEELKQVKMSVKVFELSHWFEEPFFETKKLVHLSSFKSNKFSSKEKN
ncbi:MAG: 16S rRNA (guanine(527)-N(7))-methyltransferase RsmG [Bacteroidales bacterium]|nr:16S rRNA (guanine(527)-N(7))-methyltransferase RsmG [Bacteroidales bacterium]